MNATRRPQRPDFVLSMLTGGIIGIVINAIILLAWNEYSHFDGLYIVVIWASAILFTLWRKRLYRLKTTTRLVVKDTSGIDASHKSANSIR